jgi:hypothetical protein
MLQYVDQTRGPDGTATRLKSGYRLSRLAWLASRARAKGAVMSDEFHFNDEDDAKSEIRAAVRYLLNGAAGSEPP